MQPKVKFMGVYSTKQRKSPQRSAKPTKEYFFVWQVRDENETFIHVQEIDNTYTPKGKVFAIDQTTLSYFTFEPSILAVPLTRTEEVLKILKPKKPKIEPLPEIPEDFPDLPLIGDAAQSAAELVEAVIRKDFETAVQQLNDPDMRIRALRQIKAIPDKQDIKPVHKHMLRDFAIVLRKKNLPEVALVFAEKTVSLAPKDDHAHFNLARIYYLLSRYRDAIEQIYTALNLPHAPEDEPIYRKLLLRIENEERLHNSIR
ncbi:MAG: hypothetical protein IJS54_01015 [Desulfovibrio sp.]|nr:hypothetical protein [Desulfovibrio sp.]